MNKNSENLVWKAYSEGVISHSMAHYLMAIDKLNSEQKNCKAIEIAKMLNISRNAVSLKIKTLQSHNLITISEKNLIDLTAVGVECVNNILVARRTVKRFLVDFLNVSEKKAEEDSCKVEHLISHETRNALMKLMQLVNDSPAESQTFLSLFNQFDVHCEGKKDDCPLCQHGCLMD